MPLLKSDKLPPLTQFTVHDMEQQAQSLLLRAKRAADRLLAQAQKEADALRAAAQAEGFQTGQAEGVIAGTAEGFKAGHTAAVTEAGRQMGELFKTVQSVLGMFDEHRRTLESLGVDEVVQLALAVAKRITKRQSAIDPEVVKANLADAMRLAVQAADVRVIVHPSQKQLIDEELPAVKLQWPDLKHIEVVGDAAVEIGGCRLITNRGSVDAQIETQLDRIVAEMMPEKE